MADQVIICPYCKKEIPLTEAISHQIKENLRKEFEAEAKRKAQELAEKEQVLSIKEKELENSKKSLEEQVTKMVQLEIERLEKEAKQKAEEAATMELKDLRAQIEEKDKKLQEAQKAELELRKQRRELEESKRTFELEMIRKLDEEREKIREAASKSLMEDHNLKISEKEKQIEDMRKQIDELRRKAEQGSQQMQGEVLELELEDILKENFPLDYIEPVPKGIKGGDILQKVNNQSGQYCGMIIWESKRTKAWNDNWIPKLKEDQREARAEIAILLTSILPKDVINFGYINGIWVTNYISIIPLTTTLRITLNQIASTKMATVGKHEKMEVLYNYLCGPEFRHKVEAIVESFVSMKEDLDQEKRAMTRIWSKREKQIEKVIINTAKMYGDMQGIIGASLPQIKNLELKALTKGIETNELNDDNNE